MLTISKNISGQIPQEMGSLKDLEVLDFHQNCFNGSIPEALGINCPDKLFLGYG
jgi:hypothetical protein